MFVVFRQIDLSIVLCFCCIFLCFLLNVVKYSDIIDYCLQYSNKRYIFVSTIKTTTL